MDDLQQAMRELEEAVDRCQKLSQMTIIFSLPKFQLDYFDWLIWSIDQRN